MCVVILYVKICQSSIFCVIARGWRDFGWLIVIPTCVRRNNLSKKQIPCDFCFRVCVSRRGNLSKQQILCNRVILCVESCSACAQRLWVVVWLFLPRFIIRIRRVVLWSFVARFITRINPSSICVFTVRSDNLSKQQISNSEFGNSLWFRVGGVIWCV